MTWIERIILVGAITGGLISCKNDSSMAGRAVLDENDKILVKENTFLFSSTIDTCDYIIAAADSFLIGERQTETGAIRADLLTQLACPEGYSYPETTEFDSIKISIYYSSWTGDNLAPLSINMYEMDKATLEYAPEPAYHTNEDLEKYCSLEPETRILEHERIIVAENYQDSAYSMATGTYVPMVSFNIDPNSAFFQRFTSHKRYTTQDDFSQNILKGLYITTDFGGSTVLHVVDVTMQVYYHFTYKTFLDRDTLVNDVKGFYANAEVKQLNRYLYQDRSALLDELRADTLYDYLVAPAGIYTYIDLPMRQIYDTILGDQYDTKVAYVNLAQIRVQVYDSTWVTSNTGNARLAPQADYVMLMKAGENNARIHSFFENKELPLDTVAILSPLYSGVDSVGNTIHYYSFDISTVLTNILHSPQTQLSNNQEMMRMALVPVTVSFSANNSTQVTSIKEAQTISATRLYSAKNPATHMSLQVVSSLFSKMYR